MSTEVVNLQQVLDQAIAHHQAGQLQQAEMLYNQILQQQANFPPAIHLLGVLAHQVGKNELARDLINQAIQLNPNEPTFYGNLGLVYQALNQLDMAIDQFLKALNLNSRFTEAYNNLGYTYHLKGQFEEALNLYQKALECNPNFAPSYYNMGNTFQSLRRPQDALASYQKAIGLNPGYAEAYNNMGNVVQALGNLEEAAQCFKKAFELNPGLVEAYYNYGNAIQLAGQPQAAIPYYEQALKLRPHYPEVYTNYGFALQLQGQMEEAIAKYDMAMQLKPGYPDPVYNKGTAYQLIGRLDDAMLWYQQAIKIKPDYAEVHNNIGTVYKAKGEYEKALDCYKKAIETKGGYSEPHWNRSLIWLLQGDFENGWPEYEWRKTKPKFVKRTPTTLTEWDGGSLKGKKLLVMAEQGMGDTFQFMRYLPLLKKQGAKVFFEFQPELGTLLQNCAGVDQLVDTVAPDAPSGDYDAFMFLMSAPYLLKTDINSIPPVKPQLKLDTGLIKKWQKRFSQDKNFKVGIVWSGNPQNSHNPERSCTLADFGRLADIPGVSFYALQKGDAAVQALSPPNNLKLFNLEEMLVDFADTAAAIQHLDLVISVDTAVTHLAGALEKPVWTILHAVPDWRWLLDREDCPWYPSMRLFRQQAAGEWDSVFDRVHEALAQQLKPSKKAKSKK